MVWIPCKDNDADLFTKNLDGPAIEWFAQDYEGVDAYALDPLNWEGVDS